MARKGAKTGGMAQLKPKPAAKSKKVESESEAESDASESFMQFKRGKKHDSDEEDDREVFNLAMNDDDSENEDANNNDSDDNDDDDYESEDNSEDDDDDYEGDSLRNLVDNLPQNLRQKVLMKKGDEDSESEAEESEEEDEGWGKKKSTYWNGDTGELEIGQSMEDAEDEEAAALDLQKGKLAKMKASDFYEEFDNDESEEESEVDEAEQNMGSKLKNKQKAAAAEAKVSAKTAKKLLKKTVNGGNDDKVIADLELIALGKSNTSDVQVEKLQKDVSKLSKKQKLDLLQAQSPELLGIVNELKERVNDLKNNLQPLKEFLLKVAAIERVPDELVEYLEVKEQLLLAYCTNVVFYLYMKAQGKSVRAHPVMKQLLKLRYVMEKMRPLDNKLKYQIDRLVKLSELSPQEAAGQVAGLLRPNPSALMGRDGDDDDDDNNSEMDEDQPSDSEDESSARRGGKKGGDAGIYKAPKISAMPYEENESQSAKRDSKMEKQRKKLKHSELMETLREEFGSAPETAGSGGVGRASGDLKALQEEAEERKRFEEERFVRMTMSRKDKKDIKRRTAEANRLDNFDDIGDIGDFEEFAKMARQSSGLAEDGSLAEALGKKSGRKSHDDEYDGAGKSGKNTAAALQRAVDALAQSDAKKSKNGSKKGGSDDALVTPGERKKISVEDVAAALSGGLGGGDFSDDDDDFEAPPQKGKKAAGKKSKPNYDDFGGDDSDGGEMDPYSAFLEADSRKRRRAPDDRMNDFDGGEGSGDEDDDNLVEEFGQKKKAFLNKKKDHYTAEPRYGGREETVDADRKRAATYEIMKNKGLTPHRKKEARNPRVMKRMKYEKAQIARKGQVREVIKGAAGAYGGEMTGIKAGISRSRRM